MSSPYGEDIAVLKDQMKDVKTALDRIEANLDLVIKTKADKTELRGFKFITVPTVILLTAILTALVGYYFTHNKPAPLTTVTNTNTTTPGVTPSSSSTTNTTTNTTTPSSDLGGSVDSTLKQVGL